jgi:GR25 family glycosyltransferase involved in LPS biosynthesis
MEEIWREFLESGSIRCINLRDRHDRYKESNDIFRSLSIPVEYYFADRCPEGGVVGCFNSHINVLSESYDRGVSYVLVFEDDVVPSPYLNQTRLKEVLNFIKGHNIDLFYLGTNPTIWDSLTSHVSGNIYRMKSICAHAYIASRKYMTRLYGLKYGGVAIDYVYQKDTDSYGVYPSLFYQRGGTASDISDKIPLIASFKHKDKVFRAVEWYAVNVNIAVKAWVLLALSVLLILIIYFAYYTL